MNRHPWKTIVRLALLVAIFFLMPYSHIVHAHATRADPHVRERRPAYAGLRQSTVPTIDLWYGTTQVFGNLGLPQDRINILGNLSPSDAYLLQYQINGSTFQPVSLRNVRLVNDGDFNIELFDPNYNQAQARIDVPPELRLVNGVNTLILRVLDAETEEEIPDARRQVTIHYTPLGMKTWPLPYAIDWSSADDLMDVAQGIDGKWEITGDGVRILEPGYDRLIGIGDITWDDYEVRTSFIIHQADAGNVGGIGVIIGWQGHYRRDSENPSAGWAELGAYGYYSLRLGQRQVMRINDKDPVLGPTISFTPGKRFHLRMQVESDPGDSQISHYRLKVWADGASEPADWGVELADTEDTRPHGSVLLVAHLVDATFGNVSITPLNQGTCHSLDVLIDGGGAVDIDPEKGCYPDGDTVALLAEPESGYLFQGWTVDGQPGGTDPMLEVQMTENRDVRAIFVPESPAQGSESVYLPMIMR